MNTLKDLYLKYFHNILGVMIALSLLLNLVIEMLSRKSFAAGFVFIQEYSLIFLYNSLIIFAILSFSILFRRRVFMLTLLSVILLAGGIVNFIIVSERMTPFTVYDILVLKEGFAIASNYLSAKQIVLGIIGVVVALVGIVILWIKAPKLQEKIKWPRNLVLFGLIVAATAGVTNVAIKSGIVDDYFPNLAYGYRDNGFVYCFLNTWLNTGIHKPDNYNEESIQSLFTESDFENYVAAKGEDGDESHPNIIFVQLESFMDPDTVEGLEYSQDAIPNFRALMQEYSSGAMKSPAVGAGTANVEFEVITGMSVRFFGPGEYPHKGILREETCESVAYDLKTLGYSTHAIHDHRGAFYNRNEVFPNLGFDTFTSLEYMNNVNKTPKNWAKDKVLTSQIEDTLNATEGPDYIYAISVQGHGSYPVEPVLDDPVIQVTSAATEEDKWSWEYYLNQLYEMDQFVGELTEVLEQWDEDVVVVFYGDHLPAINGISDETLSGRSIYQTDYVIWSNFDMEKEDRDLAAYQLSANVLDRLDIHQGTLVAYHQKYRGSSTYMEGLQALEYDILYGEQYIYDGRTPFLATDMQMGVKEIKVDEVVQIGDKYYIKGENFTEYSKINLDGQILKTIYLGPTLLGLLEDVDPEAASRMKVSQVEKDKEILSTTE